MTASSGEKEQKKQPRRGFTRTGEVKIGDQSNGSGSQSGRHSAVKMWLLPFTRFHKLPVFERIWLYLAFMAAYTLLVVKLATPCFPAQAFREAGGAAYSGIILGLLLVFRTNAAYERWWEGRKLWGQLVNDSRNLSIKIRACAEVASQEKDRLGDLIISFAYALKHHLRGSKPANRLPGLGTSDEIESEHLPIVIAGRINESIWRWYAVDRIDGFEAQMMDQHARAFMDICGACERIKNSPLAVSYRAFMRQGIALNLLALPWYVAPDSIIWWSLPVILIASYFLIGLELIAEDIEDPFGYDGDDLPLDQLCDTIKRSVNEILPVEEEQSYTASNLAPRIDPLKEH